MTSSQPYLIRAIYEWIVDNDLTPYLMVDAKKRGTIVPEDYLDELGRIILNISPSATSGLLMTNEEVTFSARFSGQSMSIVVPVYSVRAIYARENGQGMMFDESNEPAQDGSKKRVQLEAVGQGSSSGTGVTHSSAIDKKADTGKAAAPETGQSKDKHAGHNSDDTRPEGSTPGKSDSGKSKSGKNKKGGPHLKVIK